MKHQIPSPQPSPVRGVSIFSRARPSRRRQQKAAPQGERRNAGHLENPMTLRPFALGLSKRVVRTVIDTLFCAAERPELTAGPQGLSCQYDRKMQRHTRGVGDACTGDTAGDRARYLFGLVGIHACACCRLSFAFLVCC